MPFWISCISVGEPVEPTMIVPLLSIVPESGSIAPFPIVIVPLLVTVGVTSNSKFAAVSDDIDTPASVID